MVTAGMVVVDSRSQLVLGAFVRSTLMVLPVYGSVWRVLVFAFEG